MEAKPQGLDSQLARRLINVMAAAHVRLYTQSWTEREIPVVVLRRR